MNKEHLSVDLSMLTSSFVAEPESIVNSRHTDIVRSPTADSGSADSASGDLSVVVNTSAIHSGSSLHDDNALSSLTLTDSENTLESPSSDKVPRDDSAVYKTQSQTFSLSVEDSNATLNGEKLMAPAEAKLPATEISISRKSSSILLQPRISMNSLVVKEDKKPQVVETTTQKINTLPEPSLRHEISATSITATTSSADIANAGRP